MEDKAQGNSDDYFVLDVRQGPVHSPRRLNAAADGTLPVNDVHGGPSDVQNAALRGATDGHDTVNTAPPKKARRCPLRGNAMKCGFVVCVGLVIIFTVAYLLLRWQKRRKKKAEDALLKSFILPEADRKFLEDAAMREEKARQSAI